VGKRLFGLEAELAVSATRNGRALPAGTIVGALAQIAQRTLTHLSGGGSRMFLANGGLFYVDCGFHPEWATPECTTPSEAVSHLRAGERMVARLANLAREELEAEAVFVSRSNVDYQSGATWGCHESYLGNRSIAAYKDWLIPHLVSRIIFTGSGGLDPLSPGIRLSLSPRAAHLHHVSSQQSTSGRGIFHTREESLCNGYSRIHVLAGDNACSQLATWLKIGTTALVVALADAAVPNVRWIKLADPVAAMKGFARDLRHRASVERKLGAKALMTALDIQRHLLSQIEPLAGSAHLPDWTPAVCAAWKDALDVIDAPAVRESHAFDWALKFGLLRREIARCGFTEPMICGWSEALERIARQRPAHCAQPLHVDQAQIERLRGTGVLSRVELDEAGRVLAQQGLSWQGLDEFNALRRRLCAIDVRFGELAEGIFESLDRHGVIPEHRVVTEAEIAAAAAEAPAGSRAAVRGRWIGELAKRRDHYTCDWSGISGRDLRLDLSDPFETKGTWRKARLT
jgi:proteasome accessory factor A